MENKITLDSISNKLELLNNNIFALSSSINISFMKIYNQMFSNNNIVVVVYIWRSLRYYCVIFFFLRNIYFDMLVYVMCGKLMLFFIS